MSDRSLPGIHESSGSGKRRGLGCLGIVVGVAVLVGGCAALMSLNRGENDDNTAGTATVQCENRVKAMLKSPSTAKFDSTASGGGPWTVTGSVDSENGFGAMVRSSYQCTVEISGDTATTTVDYLN